MVDVVVALVAGTVSIICILYLCREADRAEEEAEKERYCNGE